MVGSPRVRACSSRLQVFLIGPLVQLTFLEHYQKKDQVFIRVDRMGKIRRKEAVPAWCGFVFVRSQQDSSRTLQNVDGGGDTGGMFGEGLTLAHGEKDCLGPGDVHQCSAYNTVFSEFRQLLQVPRPGEGYVFVGHGSCLLFVQAADFGVKHSSLLSLCCFLPKTPEE